MSLGTPEFGSKSRNFDTTLNSMRCRNHYWPLPKKIVQWFFAMSGFPCSMPSGEMWEEMKIEFWALFSFPVCRQEKKKRKGKNWVGRSLFSISFILCKCCLAKKTFVGSRELMTLQKIPTPCCGSNLNPTSYSRFPGEFFVRFVSNFVIWNNHPRRGDT